MDSIPVSLFHRWIAFYNISPFGEERADLRQAMICWVMASCWTKNPPDFEKFLLPVATNKREGKEQTVEEMRAALERLAKVHGRKQPDPMGPLTGKEKRGR